ncbi:lipase family protein [Paeniglutamicibacter cryotolerans]|uniref:Uncharacterized membrane protein HdeD (DUF308 family) n=1 Tax=Paeniglutamicibacter cryotolerans TaxID=670079 RepID=A0A839QG88_9MICC|nr:lipase family protein [Paeniglutamicibacter cryotolerans]MBB2995179.1 uncharacterized membrane protein HdeD (DUF308 family) [Paeniglutamicibacter cryotolerans]
MPQAIGRFPRWIHPVFGLGLVMLCSILALNSSASVRLFIILSAAGLMVIGITRIMDSAEHGTPWRASGWLNAASGALLAGAGFTALIWRGATLPVLALAVAIALLVSAAAQQVPMLNLRGDTLIWGNSQGGHGALWSAAIAAQYAPEVGILGVAALAPATNLVALAQGVKDGAAGKVVSAYIAAAWKEVYPELDVAGQLTPGYVPAVERIGDLCFDGRDALAGVIGSTQLFKPIFPDTAIDGPLGGKLRGNSADMTVGYPLFVAQGQADSLVLPGMQREWVKQRCAAGQPMEYREYPGREHMPLVEADSPLIGDLVAWAGDRLAGKEPVDSCR